MAEAGESRSGIGTLLMPEDAKHSDPRFASRGTYFARLMDAFDILSSATASLEPNVSDRAGKLPARRDIRYSMLERTFALAALMIPQYSRSGVSCLSALERLGTL